MRRRWRITARIPQRAGRTGRSATAYLQAPAMRKSTSTMMVPRTRMYPTIAGVNSRRYARADSRSVLVRLAMGRSVKDAFLIVKRPFHSRRSGPCLRAAHGGTKASLRGGQRGCRVPLIDYVVAAAVNPDA